MVNIWRLASCNISAAMRDFGPLNTSLLILCSLICCQWVWYLSTSSVSIEQNFCLYQIQIGIMSMVILTPFSLVHQPFQFLESYMTCMSQKVKYWIESMEEGNRRKQWNLWIAQWTNKNIRNTIEEVTVVGLSETYGVELIC